MHSFIRSFNQLSTHALCIAVQAAAAAAAAADTEMADAAEDDDQEEGEATLEQSEAALEQPEAAAEAQQPAAPEVIAPPANRMEMSHFSKSIARVPPFQQYLAQQECPSVGLRPVEPYQQAVL